MVTFLTTSDVYCLFPYIPTDNGACLTLLNIFDFCFQPSVRLLAIVDVENLSKFLVGQLSSNIFCNGQTKSNRFWLSLHLLAKFFQRGRGVIAAKKLHISVL